MDSHATTLKIWEVLKEYKVLSGLGEDDVMDLLEDIKTVIRDSGSEPKES